ncbi:MAG: hypothetical protein KDI54_16220 [Gammaproteobacteria bacterium]|nr:hypothetical protein [Gammaproteobacteria bacterium]
MMPKKNIKDILMAAMLMREIERARQELLGGAANTLVRAALAVAYMYIVFNAYTMLGVVGVVSVAIFFLIVMFVPAPYHKVRRFLYRLRMFFG